jgi:hypothetical protein
MRCSAECEDRQGTFCPEDEKVVVVKELAELFTAAW